MATPVVSVLTLYGLATLIFGGWIFVWIMHITALLFGKYKFSRTKVHSVSPENPPPTPGVSILKPLVGVDSNLFSNLETFFNLKYPEFELLFCLHDESDPAIMLVNRLREKYPHVDAQVFVGGQEVGVNPKVNNMMPGYNAAKYDHVMISDSGMRMREDTLLDMMYHMTDGVGLVHQLPFACDRKGFAGTLEKVYFGTMQARAYLVSDFTGINCMTGMSCIMRKDVLDEAGGLGAFGQYIAEDFFISLRFKHKGWRTVVPSMPALQNSGTCSVKNFQDRMTRWGILRFTMLPHLVFFEPCSECLLLGALASWATWWVFDWSSLAFFFTHVLVWFTLDYCLLSIVQGGPLPFSKLDYLVAWLFRESCTYLCIFQALYEPTIKWRSGGRFRIKWGTGIAERLPKGPKGSHHTLHT